MPQTFFEDGDLPTAAPCGQARISFPFEGDSHAPTHKIAWLVNGANPTTFKYQLFEPDPAQTNGNDEAFILEQDFQQHKDFFTPLPIGTPYDVAAYWSQYDGDLAIDALILVSEGPTSDMSAGQVRWTRTYATVPPPRNTYQSFQFTFPGLTATLVGDLSTDNQAFLAAFGGIANGSPPVNTYLTARVEHIFFELPDGPYSPNITDPSRPDYIVPAFRVFYITFFNERPYCFDNTWSSILSWLDAAGTATPPPAQNTIPPLTDLGSNDPDSGTPYIGVNGLAGLAEICVEQSVIRPWRGNIYEKITLFALAQ